MRRAAVLALVFASAACGTSEAPGDGGPSTSFIAFGDNFKGFRSWTSFHSDGPPDDGTIPAAVLGPRTQYISQLPPHGSTEFPVGTMIVEARESGEMKIFAGVKRGANFNPSGAKNWEWFELTENPVTIFWRGVGPPAGDTYGGDPNGGCNSCHTTCGLSNDYVCSTQLQLSNF